MNSPYDLHSWSKLYREEALHVPGPRSLEGRLRTARNHPTRVARSVAVLMLLALLLVGSGCTESDASSVNSDPVNSDASATATPSASADPNPSNSSSASASASAEASASATSSASASPDASASTTSSASPSADSSASAISSSPAPDASNYAGMRDSGSMECYTFYSDGTVELRHGGTSTVSDSGTYQGDEQFGEIVWDSGRWTSTVVADGDGYIIDDAAFSPVARCF